MGCSGDLEAEIRQFIIDTLALEHVSASDLTSETPLFGDGLGLDSVDALELGVALQKRYRVRVSAGAPDVQEHFASVGNLTRFVAKELEEQASTTR